MRPALIGAALLMGLVAVPAQAHTPMLDCRMDGREIVCTPGFSDGSAAPGMEVRIYSYADEILQKGVADGQSRVRFVRPPGEFYIRFDPGHEAPAEFDHADLPAAAGR